MWIDKAHTALGASRRRSPGTHGSRTARACSTLASGCAIAGRYGAQRAGRVAAFVFALGVAAPAFAIQTCELDGKPVNPNNGSTTAGRTGLMRCRDADTGVVQREQELRNGVFTGVERFFEKGELVKERHVDERGNGDGPAREWTLANGKRVLVLDETLKSGKAIGLVRTWYPTGARRRLTWYGDDGREEGYVEFADGDKPYALRCASRPVFGADFDDRTACGFAGVATTVLYDGHGRPASRVTFDHGQRAKSEQLADDGAVRDVREATATGAVERSFYANGTKRHEVQFTNVAKPANASATAPVPTVKTLEQDWAESGVLVRERRWAPTDRGAELVAEKSWYLNGQPKAETRIASGPQGQVRREKEYFDNGAVAFEGDWVSSGRGGSRDSRDRPVGMHRTYDERGAKRGEQVYDDGGRLTRERTYDATGALVRDDEVFEDGSRKAVGR